MPGRECYHCKQWIEEGQAHDCWTTTEATLTRELPEDLRDAWERLRDTAMMFGDQRVYASHSSIMFSRKACYFFVRPKTKYLEVVFFLGRTLKAPRIRQILPASTVKRAHIVRVTHRDEVESPLTDWLREAYESSETLGARRRAAARGTKKISRTAKKTSARKKTRLKKAKV